MPFYDVLPQPLDQVGLNPDYKFKPQWQATLPHSYFQKLADQFLEPWLEGKGKHLKRNCNALIKVAFGSKFLDIEFIYNDGVFEGRKAIEFAKKTGSKKSFSSLFLSKDWILAFRNIALLPVDGNVSLGINDDVLRVDFTTKEDSGAKHEIYIPTADLDGNRSTVPFIRYKPGLVYDESIDKINDELNIFVGGEAAALKGEVGS